MSAEWWVWIAIALAIVVVAAWPLVARRRRPDSVWTEAAARSRVAELEAALDRVDVPDKARAKAERHLLLAGAALSGGGRKAAERAGHWATDGLRAINNRGGDVS